jgi:hypothetical protein
LSQSTGGPVPFQALPFFCSFACFASLRENPFDRQAVTAKAFSRKGAKLAKRSGGGTGSSLSQPADGPVPFQALPFFVPLRALRLCVKIRLTDKG